MKGQCKFFDNQKCILNNVLCPFRYCDTEGFDGEAAYESCEDFEESED